MNNKLTVVIVALVTSLLSCTTTQAEKEDELALANPKLETFGELEEDGASYPWLSGGDGVINDDFTEPTFAPKTKNTRKTSKASYKQRKSK